MGEEGGTWAQKGTIKERFIQVVVSVATQMATSSRVHPSRVHRYKLSLSAEKARARRKGNEK